MAEIMLLFEQKFPERIFIKLEQNYDVRDRFFRANHLIKFINVVKKSPSGRRGKRLYLSIYVCSQMKPTRLKQSALKILSLLGRGIPEREIVVLYRSNVQSTALEISLRSCNIRYQVFGGQSYFERREVRDLLSYFTLVKDLINTTRSGES